MKGVILAGGTGSRLAPLNRLLNKHLIPVGNDFMIMYPLRTLIDAGIKKILIVTGREHCGDFISLLGSGEELGVDLTYKIQERAGGIAEALGLARDFAGEEHLLVMLGDNVLTEPLPKIQLEKDKAYIFLKEVSDPERFGCPEFDEKGEIKKIVEKPVMLDKSYAKAPSSYAVIGVYIYPQTVFSIIDKLSPSERGELEITDVNNMFLEAGKLKYFKISGEWTDAGTFPTLFRATKLVLERKKLI